MENGVYEVTFHYQVPILHDCRHNYLCIGGRRGKTALFYIYTHDVPSSLHEHEPTLMIFMD